MDIQCSVCHQCFNALEHEMFVNKVIRVAMCKDCYEYCYSSPFTFDEDGYYAQCIWCGAGLEIILCDKCKYSFCTICIQECFGQAFLKEIQNSDRWECFACDSAPLQELQDQCQNMLHITGNINKQECKEENNNLHVEDTAVADLEFAAKSKLAMKQALESSMSNSNCEDMTSECDGKNEPQGQDTSAETISLATDFTESCDGWDSTNSIADTENGLENDCKQTEVSPGHRGKKNLYGPSSDDECIDVQMTDNKQLIVNNAYRTDDGRLDVEMRTFDDSKDSINRKLKSTSCIQSVNNAIVDKKSENTLDSEIVSEHVNDIVSDRYSGREEGDFQVRLSSQDWNQALDEYSVSDLLQSEHVKRNKFSIFQPISCFHEISVCLEDFNLVRCQSEYPFYKVTTDIPWMRDKNRVGNMHACDNDSLDSYVTCEKGDESIDDIERKIKQKLENDSSDLEIEDNVHVQEDLDALFSLSRKQKERNPKVLKPEDVFECSFDDLSDDPLNQSMTDIAMDSVSDVDNDLSDSDSIDSLQGVSEKESFSNSSDDETSSHTLSLLDVTSDSLSDYEDLSNADMHTKRNGTNKWKRIKRRDSVHGIKTKSSTDESENEAKNALKNALKNLSSDSQISQSGREDNMMKTHNSDTLKAISVEEANFEDVSPASLNSNVSRKTELTATSSKERSQAMQSNWPMYIIDSSSGDDNNSISSNETKPSLLNTYSDSKQERMSRKRKGKHAKGAKAAQRSKSGRKEIRRVLSISELDQGTQNALNEEKNRIERIRNQNIEEQETLKLEDEEIGLVLENDTVGKAIVVRSSITRELKSHQIDGIKFMWTSCIESVKRLTESGSGCIIAHSMGLGKTIQVIAFVDAILRSRVKQLETVLVVCPKNTLMNWHSEFKKWINADYCYSVHVLSSSMAGYDRIKLLKLWNSTKGLLIMTYSMYKKLLSRNTSEDYNENYGTITNKILIDPGPDMVVCDEGHLLKNTTSKISKLLNGIKTKRRIVLTGTPLQNNLDEYYCMVNFVKPKLLGTQNEFRNRFVNPIRNGQHADSTKEDVKLMKKRVYVLNKKVKHFVQRYDYSVLESELPPKYEYVLNISMSEMQCKLYRSYISAFISDGQLNRQRCEILGDRINLAKIWTYPWGWKQATHSKDKCLEKSICKRPNDDQSETESLNEETQAENQAAFEGKKYKSYDNSTLPCNEIDSRISMNASSATAEDLVNPAPNVNRVAGSTVGDQALDVGHATQPKNDLTSTESSTENKSNLQNEDLDLSNKQDADNLGETSNESRTFRCKKCWLEDISERPRVDIMSYCNKMKVLVKILDLATRLQEKVLVFSLYLDSLRLIEEVIKTKCDPPLISNIDYCRMDGSTPAEIRQQLIDRFNDDSNVQYRVFLISTKAGSLGINLVAANRVIIFDAAWNPSHDVQAIFRAYRLGQKKPVYIYRFLAKGTMEQKIYERQVTKQSLAYRVVDEQQIQRHYTMSELQELYTFTPEPDNSNTPLVPQDEILAKIIQELHPDVLLSYHQHDSLLRNIESEKLTEEERKIAWDEYNADETRTLKQVEQPLASPTVPPFHLTVQPSRFVQVALNSEDNKVKTVVTPNVSSNINLFHLWKEKMTTEPAITDHPNCTPYDPIQYQITQTSAAPFVCPGDVTMQYIPFNVNNDKSDNPVQYQKCLSYSTSNVPPSAHAVEANAHTKNGAGAGHSDVRTQSINAESSSNYVILNQCNVLPEKPYSKNNTDLVSRSQQVNTTFNVTASSTTSSVASARSTVVGVSNVAREISRKGIAETQNCATSSPGMPTTVFGIPATSHNDASHTVFATHRIIPNIPVSVPAQQGSIYPYSKQNLDCNTLSSSAQPHFILPLPVRNANNIAGNTGTKGSKFLSECPISLSSETIRNPMNSNVFVSATDKSSIQCTNSSSKSHSSVSSVAVNSNALCTLPTKSHNSNVCMEHCAATETIASCVPVDNDVHAEAVTCHTNNKAYLKDSSEKALHDSSNCQDDNSNGNVNETEPNSENLKETSVTGNFSSANVAS